MRTERGQKSRPTIIEVDDILRGCNDSHKIRDIYLELKRKVLKVKPIQTSPNGLVTIDSFSFERKGSYEWELYQMEDSLILLEAFGYWKGYAPRGCPQPKLMDKTPSRYADSWNCLRLTIHNPTGETISRIEKILANFPESA